MADEKAPATKAAKDAKTGEGEPQDASLSRDARHSTYERVDDEEGNPPGGGGSEQTLGTPELMPLPDPTPVQVSASRRTGVGLRAEFRRQRESRPPPEWPEDWWQRNYDLLLVPNTPPEEFVPRALKLPPPPVTP